MKIDRCAADMLGLVWPIVKDIYIKVEEARIFHLELRLD
jgi:hypothetical protein